MEHIVLCICGEEVEKVGSKPIKCPHCGAFLRVDGRTPYVGIPEKSLEERIKKGFIVNSGAPVLIEWVKI